MVSTPIGNLQDVAPRALAALREADLLLAEDTRRARILLTRHGIERPVARFDAHRERDVADRVVARIAAGDVVALVSDAGTPGVSDPGAALVRAVRAAGLPVTAIPGPSAVTAAVAAAGVDCGFLFLGFLPRKGTDRRRHIDRIRASTEAVVLFESPARLPSTLADLGSALGPSRRAVVCREMTKLHEEIVEGTLPELAERFASGVLGEVTVVVLPADDGGDERAVEPSGAAGGPTPGALAARLLAEGLPPSRVARVVADLFGMARREAYRLAHDGGSGPPRL